MRKAAFLFIGLALLAVNAPALAAEAPAVSGKSPDEAAFLPAPGCLLEKKLISPGSGLLPVAPTFQQWSENCCCTCDMRGVYWSCMDSCGWAESCHNDCNNQWMAAENECIETCPCPIC